MKHNFFLSILRGPAQVIFQANALTGALILLGICVGAIASGKWEIAVGAPLGLLVSHLTGLFLRLPKDEGVAGLWGFNGVLVGCAIPTFVAPSPLMWIVVVLCSAMTTWVRVGLNLVGAAHKVNSLTFPFVLCTWLFLASSRLLDGMDGVGLSHPMLPAIHHFDSSALLPSTLLEAIEWPLRGVAQIMLSDSAVVGLTILIALAINSPRASLWTLVGSVIGTYGAIWAGGSQVAVESGLYGYSPALTAVALGAVFYPSSVGSAIWATLGAIVTLFVQAATNLLLEPLGLPALTAPFCITTWLFLLPLLSFAPNHKADHSSWHKEKSSTADSNN